MVRSTAERRSPYKGLIPYSEADAPFFFGREKETRLITANLFAASFTLLYGASGVGKSSALRAGVAHGLRPREDLLVVVFNAWQSDPVVKFKETVAAAAARLNRGDVRPVDPSLSLAGYLAAYAGELDRRLMIILDQFEEYFLYHPGDDAFAADFPKAVMEVDTVSFLVSIREDSLAKLDRFEGRIPTLFDNYLRIEHLNRAAARAAIEKPIEQYNSLYADHGEHFGIEPGLVEEVLKQVETGQVVFSDTGRGVVKTEATEAHVETPYLQLVMTRLWDEETSARSNTLRLETLTELGGAQRIVRTHLDATMAALPPDEKDLAAHVFHYLVTPSGTKIAHTVPDLAGYTHLPQGQLASVMEKLAGGGVRILRPVDPAQDQPGVPRYEIFHDVLAPAVLDWRRRHKEQQKQEEIRVKEQEQRRQEQAEAARKRELERGRWARRALIGSTALLILMAGLAGYSFVQRNDAIRARNEALRAQKEASEAQSLAQQRYDRIRSSIYLKEAALSGDKQAITAALESAWARDTRIEFAARAEPIRGRVVNGFQYYDFEVYPKKETLPEAAKSVAIITYKMDHPAFKNSLITTGPNEGFTASYQGWGCMCRVIAVIEYANPDQAPIIVNFNMCEALGWDVCERN